MLIKYPITRTTEVGRSVHRLLDRLHSKVGADMFVNYYSISCNNLNILIKSRTVEVWFWITAVL